MSYVLTSARLRSIKRRTLLASAAGLFATPSIVRAQTQNGVGLVIGNSKYQWEAPLPNVKRDAPSMARAFQALGLGTELVLDAGRAEMLAAIKKFAAAQSAAGTAVLNHGPRQQKCAQSAGRRKPEYRVTQAGPPPRRKAGLPG
jgi:hypothetical protein